MRIITDKGLTNLKGMLTTMHMQTISLRKYSLSVHWTSLQQCWKENLNQFYFVLNHNKIMAPKLFSCPTFQNIGPEMKIFINAILLIIFLTFQNLMT
jgi:hypothetical protein